MEARVINNIISIDPEVVSGTPVFLDTRVPVKTLFDYIEGGHTIAEFLDDFPTVKEEYTHKALHIANQLLVNIK
jgi:uncharacterized protein (DUF433 family)